MSISVVRSNVPNIRRAKFCKIFPVHFFLFSIPGRGGAETLGIAETAQ